ncbi:MAG: flagellar hook-length control protein [Burkholderiaceae bacterium]|nr:flagellar hook-length control protein [Burkholderiaceae bacterium]
MSSIAISAIVKPSRLLLRLQLVMCLCVALAGVTIGAGIWGHYPFAARWALAATCFVCAFIAILQILRQRIAFSIDISGIGQIRLRQYNLRQQEVAGEWESVRLTEASTIWPGMMFLCLESRQGKKFVLRVLPDSVSADEFRALSVACRWIVARGGRQDDAQQ